MPRSANVNGALPFTIKVAGTEPTPMNTRKAVPMNSAVSRWAMEVSSSMRAPSWRIYRIAFDNVERVADVTPVIHSGNRRESFGNRCANLRAEGRSVIQSVDRAIRVLTALQGARRITSVRAGRPPGAGAVDRRTASSARWSSTGWCAGARVEPLPAGPGRAAARQRLPGHARAAVQGHPLGRGSGPQDRMRGPHGRCCWSTTW